MYAASHDARCSVNAGHNRGQPCPLHHDRSFAASERLTIQPPLLTTIQRRPIE